MIKLVNVADVVLLSVTNAYVHMCNNITVYTSASAHINIPVAILYTRTLSGKRRLENISIILPCKW